MIDVDIHNMWKKKRNSWEGSTMTLATIYLYYDKQIKFDTEAKINITRSTSLQTPNQIEISFKGTSLSFTA